jgi:hypothetical protein
METVGEVEGKGRDDDDDHEEGDVHVADATDMR